MFEAIIIILLIAIVIIGFNRGWFSHGVVAEQINIDGLNGAFTDLKNGRMEFDFFGITSDGIDCIYFIQNENGFDIEFEAMGQDQLPYIQKIKDFAASNELPTEMTTYGNKPDFESDTPAPVLRIITSFPHEKISKFAEKLQSEVFGNNSQTGYSIVP